MTNAALLTDRYEISMLDALIREGRHNAPATFEVFARRLQPGFRYGVVAGLGRLLPKIQDFYFPTDALDALFPIQSESLCDETAYYLNDYRFKGTIEAYREGDLYFPHSPILSVTGTLGECIVLETLILSILNHDSAIATKAARIKSVAHERSLIEMGSRRTHEEAAIAAARSAYIAGFDATSNLAAGYEHGIPTTGTAAHAFTLAHQTETTAFEAQARAQGTGTTFLVDTYDTRQGIENAIVACRSIGGSNAHPGAVRIDSGDLAAEAHTARGLLDRHGAFDTKIIVTSDLDEYVLKDLRDAPIDGYGVGTQLVSTPPAGMVYKLVEIDGRPVAKKSKDKISVGGRKHAWREYAEGRIVGEKFTTDPYEVGDEGIQELVMHDGEILHNPSLAEIREFHTERFLELPVAEQTVWNGKDFGPLLTVQKEA